MNGKTEEYPLCEKPIKVWESTRKKENPLTKLFKGFADGYESLKQKNG